MMFKKFVIAAPLAVLALSSSLAFAAEPISQTINVRAFIPTSVFNVAPLDDQFGRDQEILLVNPNDSSAGFKPVSAVHIFKNTDPTSAIYASIDGGQGAATLYSGAGAGIPMTVSIGEAELTEVSKEVANKTETVAGVQRAMTIRTATPTAAQTGSYAGSFTVIYEPVIKP